jgi:hypothetical protein
MDRRVIPAVLVLGAACGCEVLTHAYGYTVPDYGVCAACPASTVDLRHPPCPDRARPDDPSGSADGGVPGQRYVFAWRKVSLGGDPGALASASYDVGYDQDCSNRPDGGLPAWCDPVLKGSSHNLVPVAPWAPLPHGIDNSVGERVAAPLVAFATTLGVTFDVDSQISQSFGSGDQGELTVIDDWNGTPEDADVTVRFAGSSSGTGGAPPRWDGTDTWIPNATITSYPPFHGYVTGGELVCDTRSDQEEDTTFSVPGADGGLVPFVLQYRLLVRVAAIHQDAMTVVMYGRWNLDSALQEVPQLATFLASGDQTVTGILTTNLPDLLKSAADMPLGEQPTPGVPCAALSMAVRAEAYPAKLAQ